MVGVLPPSPSPIQQPAGNVPPAPVPQVPQIPPQIQLAFGFVQMCNQHMGLRYFGECCMDDDDDSRPGAVREQELHPAQEGALRLACKALGDYFVGGDGNG